MGKTETKIDDLIGFLPYNCISSGALGIALTASTDPIFYLEYSHTVPMTERIALCEKYHAFVSRHILSLVKGNYMVSSSLKFGPSHWKAFRALRLTSAGLLLLTGTKDPSIEDSRIDACMKEGMSALRATNYFFMDKSKEEILDTLRDLKKQKDNDTPSWQLQYASLITEAIQQHCATLLVAEHEAASTVATMPHQYTGHQYYRYWKLSNIEALFRINGFLTTIDRRPFDSIWRYDENASSDHAITDVDSTGKIKKEIEWNEKNKQITFFDFCTNTLKNWYLNNPESYFFSDPFKQLTSEEISDWCHTPAFYPAHELPGFGREIETEYNLKASGAKNALRYNFMGIGIGKNCNYLIYHTRPIKTNWSEKIERTSMSAVQLTLDKNGGNLNLLGTNRTIDYAIMVCQSIPQFECLFKTWQKLIPKKWQKLRRVGAPYEGINIVTLNNAGSMLLRGLMLSSPVQFEESIINAMVQQYPEFTKSSDATYRLAYNGMPVLVAHSMDFQKLFYAWEDYQEGLEFLVSCYPEQAKFIKKLMPNVRLL